MLWVPADKSWATHRLSHANRIITGTLWLCNNITIGILCTPMLRADDIAIDFVAERRAIVNCTSLESDCFSTTRNRLTNRMSLDISKAVSRSTHSLLHISSKATLTSQRNARVSRHGIWRSICTSKHGTPQCREVGADACN